MAKRTEPAAPEAKAAPVANEEAGESPVPNAEAAESAAPEKPSADMLEYECFKVSEGQDGSLEAVCAASGRRISAAKGDWKRGKKSDSRLERVRVARGKFSLG